MAKNKIKEFVEETLKDFLSENDLELFLVEYVKEGKEKTLRVFIDKSPLENGEERYVNISECELVSRFLSEKLDEEDPLKEQYTLTVSSPGMDRPLIHDKDYVRFAGKLIDIGFYKAVNGEKTLTAELLGKQEDIISVKCENDEVLNIPLKDIATVKLAVIF